VLMQQAYQRRAAQAAGVAPSSWVYVDVQVLRSKEIHRVISQCTEVERGCPHGVAVSVLLRPAFHYQVSDAVAPHAANQSIDVTEHHTSLCRTVISLTSFNSTTLFLVVMHNMPQELRISKIRRRH
jgi:hypothetical protein